MAHENPYKPPSPTSELGDVAETEDAIELTPSFGMRFLYTFFAAVLFVLCLYLVSLAMLSAIYLIKLAMLALAIMPAYGSYLMISVLWDRQTINSRGIQIYGTRSEFIPWDDITWWEQESQFSVIRIKLPDGREMHLNNLGNRRENETLARMFKTTLRTKMQNAG